jgi:hypothetical protein
LEVLLGYGLFGGVRGEGLLEESQGLFRIFGWTLGSQYRFRNLERIFFYCLLMALDFESFTYSVDFSSDGKYLQ